MNKLTVRDLAPEQLRGKRALVRVDFNVPLDADRHVTDDTSSSSVYSRIPFIGPDAAARNASLIASTVTGFSTTTARSVSDTSGVGTRIAMPSILPLSSGMTSEVAFAAPVVVGMIERAAARARRKSLCGKSSTF